MMSLNHRAMTIEDVSHLKFLGQPCISPDGQRVAFAVTTIDKNKHDYRASIWMVPSGGHPRLRLKRLHLMLEWFEHHLR